MPIEINSSTAKAGSYVIAQNLPYSAGCSMEQIFTPINIIKGGSAPGPGFARPLTPSFEKGMFNNESVGPTILELNPYFPVIFGDDGSNFIGGCDYNLVVHAPSNDFNIKKNPNRAGISQIKTQGLRSPIILSGWGYDIAGMPVPTNNGTDFNPNMINQRSLWKTGPLHVMWDDERQIWTGGYQIVYGVIKAKIDHPNGPLASTTFKVKVLRRINGELSTDLGEEITCKNRDIDFQYQIADEDIDDEKVFVVCARINYEWIILWKSKKDNIYMGKFKGEWKFGETKIVEQTSPEPRESEKYRQVVNSIYQNISGKGEEEINCIFSYFDDIFQLISLEVSNPIYFGYFMGKWDLNNEKTVRQTKPEPAAGQEEVQVTNTLFEKDIARPNNEQTQCSFTRIGDAYYLVSVEQSMPMYVGYFTGDAKRNVDLEVTQIHPEPSAEDLGKYLTVKNKIFDRAGDGTGQRKNYCMFTKIGNDYELVSIQPRNENYFGTFTGEWKKNEKKDVSVTIPRPVMAGQEIYAVENLIYTSIGSSSDDKPRYCHFIRLAPGITDDLGLTEADRYLLVAAEEESSPLFFGYFRGKWEINDDKTVRQTKPEPEEGKEEVTVTNIIYETDIHKPDNELTQCSFTKIEDEYYLVSVEQQTNQLFFGYFTGVAQRGQTLSVYQLYPEPDPEDPTPLPVKNEIFDRVGESGGARNYCCFTKIDDRYDLVSIQSRNQHYFGTYTGEWKQNEKKSVKVITPIPSDPANTEIEVENLIYEKLGSSSDDKPKYCYFVQLAPAIGDNLGQGVPDKFILVAAEETASEVRIGYFGDVWRRLEEKEVVQVFPSPADGETEVTVKNLIFNEIGVAGNQQHYCSFTKIDDKYYLISADTEPSTRFGTFSSQAKRGLSTMVTQTHPPPNPEQAQVEAINLLYDEIGEPGGSDFPCAFTKIKDQYYIISVQQYDGIYFGVFSGKWAKGASKTVTRQAGGNPKSVGTQETVQNPWADVLAGNAIYVKIGQTNYLIAAVCDPDAKQTGSSS